MIIRVSSGVNNFFLMLLVLATFMILSMALGVSPTNAALTTQITDNNYEDSDPLVSDGKIVWIGHTNNNYALFLYDIATATTTQITNDNYWDDSAAKVSDGKVVWARRDHGGYSSHVQIFLYDIATATTTQITNTYNGDTDIQISDGKVVWTRYVENVDESQIFLYDIATATTTQLTDGTYTDVNPYISDGKIVWSRYAQDFSSAQIFLYDIATATTTQLTDGSYYVSYSYISNGDVVWYQSDGNDSEIFLWNEPISNNNSPTIPPFQEKTINEGDTYSETGSFTDSDSTSWTGTVNYGDGTGEHAFASSNETIDQTNKTFTISHVYTDNQVNDAPYTVTVKITDNQGAASNPATATITVHNAAPTVGNITASVNPIPVNTSTTTSATFTDPGVLDTHTAIWDWGDGSTSPGNVSESNGSGSVGPDSHTYTTAGVYQITLTVTDKDGGSGSQTYQYLSVYAPTPNGIFSSGTKYDSPAGAYIQNPSLTGNVKFGFVYKYQGGAPSAQNAFSLDFKNANFKFNATAISTLVISNGVGTLTGTGDINGQGTYNFLIVGNEATDKIRIKITDPANNNAVIYDTQPGASDTAAPSTSVNPGHVVAN